MKIEMRKTWIILFLCTAFLITLFTGYAMAADANTPKNISVMRSAHIRADKMQEAVLLAREIMNYLNEKFPESSTRVYLETFGALGKIYWISQYENLAAVERVGMMLMMDPGYNDLVKRATSLFIEGSVYDTLLMAVP